MTVTVLNSLKEFLEKEVLATLKLKRQLQNISGYELVTPLCHIGYIPPNGDIVSNDVSIPCVVVGVDKKISSEEETLYNIRLTAAIFDNGFDDGLNPIISDFMGFVSLQNLLDSIEASIMRNPVLCKSLAVVGEIESALYEQQPFPFWYGYLKFQLSDREYPNTRYSQLL